MIGLIRLQAEIRSIAALYPNAVYHSPGDGCYYNHGEVYKGPETQGCLIGQAIRNLDPQLFEKIGNNADDIICLMSSLSEHFDKSADENGEIKNWLSVVQIKQDDEKTWSEAVRIADLSVEEETEEEMIEA